MSSRVAALVVGLSWGVLSKRLEERSSSQMSMDTDTNAEVEVKMTTDVTSSPVWSVEGGTSRDAGLNGNWVHVGAGTLMAVGNKYFRTSGWNSLGIDLAKVTHLLQSACFMTHGCLGIHIMENATSSQYLVGALLLNTSAPWPLPVPSIFPDSAQRGWQGFGSSTQDGPPRLDVASLEVGKGWGTGWQAWALVPTHSVYRPQYGALALAPSAEAYPVVCCWSSTDGFPGPPPGFNVYGPGGASCSDVYKDANFPDLTSFNHSGVEYRRGRYFRNRDEGCFTMPWDAANAFCAARGSRMCSESERHCLPNAGCSKWNYFWLSEEGSHDSAHPIQSARCMNGCAVTGGDFSQIGDVLTTSDKESCIEKCKEKDSCVASEFHNEATSANTTTTFGFFPLEEMPLEVMPRDWKFNGAAVAPNGLVVFAPAAWRNATRGEGDTSVGLFNASAKTFESVNISGQVHRSHGYFAGAAVAPNGLVVFAPNFFDGVGLFNASDKIFELVDIPVQNLRYGYRFDGAATAPNGLVVFAPSWVDVVGLFNASARTFEMENISGHIEQHPTIFRTDWNHTDIEAYPNRTYPKKFSGAAVAPNGLVVFVPSDAHGVGLFNASARTFEVIDISDKMTDNAKFAGAAVAPNGLVVFVPSWTRVVGLFDASAKTFELVNISNQVPFPWEFGSLFQGAAVTPNGMVVFAPFQVDGVGLFNASAKLFEVVDISEQISTTWKFRGAAVAPNGLVVFAPSSAEGVGVFQGVTSTTPTEACKLFSNPNMPVDQDCGAASGVTWQTGGDDAALEYYTCIKHTQ